ncbi:MAG: hypothetical protein IKG85_08735 [Clostridia bacterium]|nr:hypothetical protein [Clostridia bacterium]
MENKFARFMRNTGFARFFLPLGIILIVVGIIFLSTAPKEYGEATAIITNIDQYTDADDNVVNDVTVKYTVDGKEYTSELPNMSGDFKAGDELKIYYDAANPQSVSNTKSAGIIAPIMIVLGVLALVASVFSVIKAFRKSRELDEQIKSAAGTDKMPVIEPLPKSQLTEYYVRYDGAMLKPGYIVEDAARNVIIEASMTKNALVGSRLFTFRNNVKGTSVEHEVGHTVSSEIEGEMFSRKSYFKFDGRNIWDVLHEQGIRIQTGLFSKFPNLTYTISRNGAFIATAETSGQYVHEEDAAQHKVNIPVGRFYYRVWTNESDLDQIFLTIFAISETEQIVVE